MPFPSHPWLDHSNYGVSYTKGNWSRIVRLWKSLPQTYCTLKFLRVLIQTIFELAPFHIAWPAYCCRSHLTNVLVPLYDRQGNFYTINLHFKLLN
jgi:hypothetical protein